MKIAATQFKAQSLSLIERVAQTREEVVITKHGRPMARLVPVRGESVPELFGCLSGTVVRATDIVGPVGEDWDAERD